MSFEDVDLGELSGYVLDSINSGVMVVDLRSHLRYLNQEAIRLLGPGLEAAKDRPILEDSRFFPFIVLVNEHRKEGPSDGRSRRQVACQIQRPDGGTCPLSTVVSNLKDRAGTVRGYVLVFRDISETRALEARVRRTEQLAEIGSMAAGLAHEIRNPLASIHSATELLEARAERGGDVAGAAQAIYAEVDRLARLVNDVLRYSRIDAVVPAPTELAEWLASAAADLTVPAGIAFSVTVEDPLPPVSVDPDRLRQVLLNLVRNAVEAQPDGGEVEVLLGRGPRRVPFGGGELEPVPTARLAVRDTGPGIAPEDLAKLFQPYFTRRSSGEGTGLGLGLSQRLVEAHGGTLEVASVPGEGSCFTVLLPLEPASRRSP